MEVQYRLGTASGPAARATGLHVTAFDYKTLRNHARLAPRLDMSRRRDAAAARWTRPFQWTRLELVYGAFTLSISDVHVARVSAICETAWWSGSWSVLTRARLIRKLVLPLRRRLEVSRR
jgi:hypothetical protein